MSEMTPCNRCSLDRMKRQANARGVKVITKIEGPESDTPGWISAWYSDQDEPTAWFMQLTERCVC